MALREVRREATVNHLLQCAARVFASSGYHGASMEQIAREARCAAATLYGYFKSKGELFNTLVERRYESYLDELQTALAGAAGLEASLLAWRSVLADHTLADRDFLTLMLAQSRRAGGLDLPQPERIVELNDRYRLLAEGVLARGVVAGELQPRPAALLAMLLLGSLHGAVFAWLLAGAGDDLEATLGTAIEVFLRGAGGT